MTSSTVPKVDYTSIEPERAGQSTGRGRAMALAVAASKPILALAVITAVGLLLLAFPGQLFADYGAVFAAVIYGCLRLLAELLPIHNRRERVAEATTAVDFALLLLVGLGAAVLIAALTAAVRTAVEGTRARTVHPLIVVARAVVVVGMAGLVLEAIAGPSALSRGADSIVPLVAAGITYALVDMLMAVVSSAPAQREALFKGWLRRTGTAVLQYLGLLVLGAITALVYTFSALACLILVLPIFVAHFTMRTAIASRRSIRRAIESLAAEIDDREAYTARHSERCALYARKICQGLRIGAHETDLIVGVAKIHDLGKMNIWPEMLNKAGPLDDAERLEMNRHPAYGAEILSGFVDYRQARDIIMHHHEWWDGQGYPAGLKGEQIPLGSRVVSVVDAFDAMTSNRPYRPAMSYERAIGELERNAGRQFDPAVVRAFVATVRPEDVPQNATSRPFMRTVEPARG